MPRQFADLSSYRRLTDLSKANAANPLDSLLQGAQQGLQLSRLPQTLQDQELARQLNNALMTQKLKDLQNPNDAFNRKLKQELILKGAGNSDMGIEQAQPGLENVTLGTPNAISPTQQSELISNPEGPIPSVRPGAPITPILGIGGSPTGLVQNPNTPEKAAADKLDRQIRLLNAKPETTILTKEGLAYHPRTGTATNVILPENQSLDDKRKMEAEAAAQAKVDALNDTLNKKQNFTASENEKNRENQKDLVDLRNSTKGEKAQKDLTDKLYKEVQSNKAYQAHRTVSDAVEGLQATLDYAKTNPTDQTGIKSSAVDAFNKIVNPNSVVRQQAFSQTTSGQSLINKFDNFVNGLATGQTITPEQIQTMLDIAKKYQDGSRKSVEKELTVIKHRGDKAGLDTKDYLPDLYNTPQETPSSTPSKIGRFTITVH